MVSLEHENESLRHKVARLSAALEEVRSKLAEPEDIIRAIRQGEIDALVVQERGKEEIYSLQRFDSAYRVVVEECFPYGVWLAEQDGRVLYVSRSFLELVQSSLEDMRGKGQFHFLHPDVRGEVERLWAKSRETKEPLDVEYQVNRGDGTERTIWTHGILTQTQDGLPRWAGVNIDITERQKIKQQLRQQALALQEADHQKDQFLATLAHELRNPLAPIRNALELLRVDSSDATLIEQARSIMDRQMHRIVRLVDDLLDISRITTGKIELRIERVDLAVIVRSAVEAARPLIESKGQQLTVSLPTVPVYLNADPNRLAQVFANLLDNAAKYTDPGGHIWLTAEQQGNEVTVSVRDTGVGISADHLASIFKMYSQVRSVAAQSLGGLGIGLSLVKGLIELHGGTVEVESDGENRGSKFTVHLPVGEARAETSQTLDDDEQSHVRPSKCRILVVDDNRDSADSLAMLLSQQGHDTRRAYDGLEAMQESAAWQPDVVFTDIGMPKLSGYEVASGIREQSWGKKMILIAMTGWGTDEDKRRALEAGFNHHLTKPVQAIAVEKLLAMVFPQQQA